jgi:hypothetical protein
MSRFCPAETDNGDDDSSGAVASVRSSRSPNPPTWTPTARMTTEPPTSVATFGVSDSAIQVHSGPSTTSSRKIIAISEDGMNRAAEMKKIAPSPIWPHPSRASHPTSAQERRPNCANGAKTITTRS